MILCIAENGTVNVNLSHISLKPTGRWKGDKKMKKLNENVEELREYVCDHVCRRIQIEADPCQTCKLEEYTKRIEEKECEKGMLKCDVCGFEFEANKKNHYKVSRKNLIGPETPMDCFDCPNCGCQIMAKERV